MAAILRNRRYARAALSSNAPAGYARNRRAVRDMAFGGDGILANPENDPITLDGAPYRARLRVFVERGGLLVRETWSAADGTWSIPYLDRNQAYLVVCYDGETYPPLAGGPVTPDPME